MTNHDPNIDPETVTTDRQPPTTLVRPREILGHPVGLFLLFLVEMWERFSYYGMRGLLVLYLTTVIAVHQLKPGTYENTLRFTEIKQVEGAADAPAVQPTQTRVLHVAVDAPLDPATAARGAASHDPALVIHRLTRNPDAAADAPDDDPNAWISNEGADAEPVISSGKRGDPKSFSNPVICYELENPTNQTIKCNIEIERPEKSTRTFFTVNNVPGVTSIDVKPEADRAAAGEARPKVLVRTNQSDSGRNWQDEIANTLYGWYTGLAYLLPILGGMIADKMIGTHRSMVVGGLVIAAGHIMLSVSGLGDLAYNGVGLSLFIFGLVLIVVGTGHFKPTVSVMVGQLYEHGDPRRDGAFTIFYMGINLGAFLCNLVCGALAAWLGWHWGFGAAAVGMLAGLALYMLARPIYLQGIGDPPPGGGKSASLFVLAAFAISAVFALAFHFGLIGNAWGAVVGVFDDPRAAIAVPVGMLVAILVFCAWFVAINRPEDRAPVASIFLFMFFNAFFWIAFEQAGSSINLFTDRFTDRKIGFLNYEVPTPFFQSINPALIILGAPIFAWIWSYLGKRHRNPSQPVKISLGLLFLGVGYIFIFLAAKGVASSIAAGKMVEASMLMVFATYFWHTVGELCLSPTGLSYVTKVAPVRFMSLLMGIWFVSSFIANLGGGLLAAQVGKIESGQIKLPWNFGGSSDFFFLFVVSSVIVGVLVFITSPWLKKLSAGRDD
ncbi:MAG: peptide MFS transporter [Phycisphaerales bacterium]|nr:peptide MFS transporter [Phycisphaerales bacterium]